VTPRILELRLRTSRENMEAMRRFYAGALGLPCSGAGGELHIAPGPTALTFEASGGSPFYHLALLAPGDRYEPARDWLAARVELLPGPQGSVDVDFSFWNALACYFHDPAGNVVELIAHREIGRRGAEGPFAPDELLGVSEIGLVGDIAAMARALTQEVDLNVWDGSVEDPRGLAFAGAKAHTLILAPAGRGWLPTGRPAEPHAVDVTLAGERSAACRLPGGHHVARLA
jgi:catechol 2,3-dioxygenase-like lactoylglutathione lyase family enzyme